MYTLKTINIILTIIFFVCYAYQFFYIPVRLFFAKRAEEKEKAKMVLKTHTFAFLICGRNEEAVIGDLIDSIRNQDYDQSLLTVFVMADNCTDHTAEVAKTHGAVVYTRDNLKEIGKGYALQELRRHITEDYPEGFDGYFVFDADNVLAPNYVTEMNKCFCAGNDVITSYRNSKNFGQNFVTMGYGVWFLHEASFLNHPRKILGASCAVSGTGFLFSRKVAEEIVDWPYHLLTEDIEFSADRITHGKSISYCPSAEFFDEQPTKLKTAWRQRMRWARGYLQVIRHYGWTLIKGIFKGSFACFDMAMNIMPAYILTIASIALNVTLAIWGTIIGDDIMIAVWSILRLLGSAFGAVFVIGAFAVITDWKRIHMTTAKKILSMLFFPFYMATYIPIAVAAIFIRSEWKHIPHDASVKKLKEAGENTDFSTEIEK